MKGKIIYWVIVILIGIGVTIARLISRTTRKLSHNSLIDRLKRDPKLAADVAEELDCTYGKTKISKDVFDQLKSKIISLMAIGPYKIRYVANLAADSLLVLTEIDFKDFQLTVTGKMNDVSERSFHNFILRYDRQSEEVTVLSDIFSDIANKFQKVELVKYLRELDVK